jgi:hypothetical protein
MDGVFHGLITIKHKTNSANSMRSSPDWHPEGSEEICAQAQKPGSARFVVSFQEMGFLRTLAIQ